MKEKKILFGFSLGFFIVLGILRVSVGSGNHHSLISTAYFYDDFEQESAPYDLWHQRPGVVGNPNEIYLYPTSERFHSGENSLHHNASYTGILREFPETTGIVEIWLYDTMSFDGVSVQKISVNDTTDFAVGIVIGEHNYQYYAYSVKVKNSWSPYIEIMTAERSESWHNFTYVIEQNQNLRCYLDNKSFYSSEHFGMITEIMLGQNGWFDTNPDIFYDDVSLRQLNTPSPLMVTKTGFIFITSGFTNIFLIVLALSATLIYKKREK